MGIVYGRNRESAALDRLEAEFGIDPEDDKGWTTWVTLVPSSPFLMRLWENWFVLFGAVAGLLFAAVFMMFDQPLVLAILALWIFLVGMFGLQYLARKGVIPAWSALLHGLPAFLAINDERVVIARLSPYRWSVRRVLVDESPRIGCFQYSDRHTPKNIGLAFVRPSSPPLYCQINDKSHEFTQDLTTRFGRPPRPDASE